MAAPVSALTSRIRVREAVPADAESIANVQNDAFAPGIMSRLLNGNAAGQTSADGRAKFAASLFPASDESIPQKSSMDSMILVAELLPENGELDETEPLEIVAFSKWNIYRKERREEEWNAPQPRMTQEMLGEGVSVQVYEGFIGQLHHMRGRWMKGETGLGMSPSYT